VGAGVAEPAPFILMTTVCWWLLDENACMTPPCPSYLSRAGTTLSQSAFTDQEWRLP
jgi:hypothetical protein